MMSNVISFDDVRKRIDKAQPDVTPTVPPFAFPVAFERLKDEKRWCSWEWRLVEGKWTKPPYRAMSNQNAASNNPTTWDTLEAVMLRAKEDEGRRGVGLMLKGLVRLGVIDLDRCITEDGSIAGWAEEIIDRCGSYTEVSPSRTGIKIYGFVKTLDTLSYSSGSKTERSYELFLNTGRYICITGEQVGDIDFLADISGVFESLAEGSRSGETADEESNLILLDPTGVQIALQKWDHDDYNEWIQAGMALKRYGRMGKQIWDEFSRRSEKFSQRRNDTDWAAFEVRDIDVATIFYRAAERGFVNDGSWHETGSKKEKEEAGGRLIRVHLPVDLRVIKPIEYILDGQIPVGSLTVAGVRGGGKTTLLAGLAPIITGTCSGLHPMRPRVVRKMIWVTEDDAQITRIVIAMINEGLIADVEAFRERFIMIQAKRSDPKMLAGALEALGAAEGRLLNKYERGEHEAAPLVLLDTVAATLEIKDENSNSDVSRAVAAVRQSITDASVWFVTHVAKGMGRVDTLKEMTARGASAFESDVQGNAVLALEDDLPDKRFLILGKKRVDVDKNEITATRMRWQTETSAVWGDRQERVSYAVLEATDQEEREEAVEDARERAEAVRGEARDAAVLAACQEAANTAAGEGFEGLVVRIQAGGGDGPIAGYEQFKRLSLNTLREGVCGIASGKKEVKDGFRQSLGRLFEVNGDIDVSGCIVSIRAQKFEFGAGGR
jgi:hypothetical protein